MNANTLRKLEDAFLNKGIEKPSKGFFTRADLAKAWQISEQQANRKLKKYVDSGLIEVKHFKVRSGMVTRPIPHYRIKND
jgi:Fic family protein